MFKRTLSLLLLCSLVNPADAVTPPSPAEGDKSGETKQHWDCHTASDAPMHKQQVENNLLPASRLRAKQNRSR